MLRCRNGSYYTGYAEDIVRRYWQHLNGISGSKFVAAFGPVSLACCWRVFGSAGDGLRLEAYIKRQSRPFKERLIRNPAELGPIAKKELGVEARAFNAALVEKHAEAYDGKKTVSLFMS